MKTLSVDSSAVTASVALVEDEKIISVWNANCGLTHSETLLPMIDGLLKNSKTKPSELDALAVSAGPGSFTGIRIGISAIKGLADGLDLPCYSVSTLKALAYNLIGWDCIACAVMDARCDQVYTAIFNIDGDKITRLTEDLALKIDDLGEMLGEYDKKVVFVGDGAILCHSRLGYEIAPSLLRYQNAASVAFAASTEEPINSAELLPVYLRLPQATRELKARKENQ